MTIRRIAGKLNSAPGSIYWHVKNKQELIALIGHAIIDQMDTDQDTTADMLRELRRAMLEFRDGCEVVAAANNSGLVRDDLIRLIRMPDENLTETAASTLLSFTLGHVQYEQFQRQLLALDAAATQGSDDKSAKRVAAKIADLQEKEANEGNRLFEEGLEAILRGISTE